MAYRVLILLLMTATPAATQTLDWVARFDDVAAGRDWASSAIASPTGEVYLLATRDPLHIFFKLTADGQVVHESRFERLPYPYAATLGPVANADGTAFIARSALGHGQNPDIALLRLGPADSQWSETAFVDPDDRQNAPTHIAAIPAGGAVVAGTSRGASDEDVRPFVSSFGPDGQLRWSARYDAAVLFSPYSLPRTCADAAGNSYVAAVVFGPNGPNDQDLLYVKYSPLGEELWARRFSVGPVGAVEHYSVGVIAANDAGELWAVGVAHPATRTFDGRLLALKFSPIGELVSSDLAPPGEYGNHLPRAIRLNPIDGGLFVAGYARSMPPTQNIYDFMLARYTPDGQRVFTSYHDSPTHANDYLVGLDVDSAGRAYLGGLSQRSSGSDFLLLQVLMDGSVGWAIQHSATEGAEESAAALLLDSLGRATLVGTTNFEHTYSDATILRWDQAGAFVSETRLNTTVSSSDSDVYGLVVSESGDVYVCGDSRQYGDEGGLVTIKYGPSGAEQWRRHVISGDSFGRRMELHPDGGVVVLGTLADAPNAYTTRNMVIVKYAPDGSELWRTVYDGPAGRQDTPADLALDGSGNIFVIGTTFSGGQDRPVLLKLDSAGSLLWSRIADEPGSGFHIAVDASGNAYVNGSGFATRKYSPDGTLQWLRWPALIGSCERSAADMAAAPDGNIVVVGRSCIATPNPAIAVIKFDPNGNLLWQVETDPVEGNATATSVSIDPEGEIYVSGYEWVGTYQNAAFATARFSPQGERRWIARYPTRGTAGTRVVLDPAGYVYTAGLAQIVAGFADYVVLRYDTDGSLRWRAQYAGFASSAGVPNAGLDGGDRGICVSGILREANNAYDFGTLRYTPAPIPCPAGNACYPGDTDGDCSVGLRDLTAVLANFGLTRAGDISPADGDLNFDGVTNLSDLQQLLAAFGGDCN